MDIEKGGALPLARRINRQHFMAAVSPRMARRPLLPRDADGNYKLLRYIRIEQDDIIYMRSFPDRETLTCGGSIRVQTPLHRPLQNC